MMKTYYFPHTNGRDLVFTETPNWSLQKKIDRFCQYNAWSTLELEQEGSISFLDKLHGYIQDGKCYDNSSILYQKEIKEFEKKHQERFVELDKFKKKVNSCIEIVEKLLGRIKKFRESKNELKRLKDKLEKGYVKVTQRVFGSKRQRRYKKNSNLRYLTETEITQCKEKIEDLDRRYKLLEKEIKYETSIEGILFSLGNTPEKFKIYARQLNHKFQNFGETMYLFSIFEDIVEKLDKDIYKEQLEKYKAVLKVEEEEKIHKEKKTKNRTQFYIDDDGNEVSIKDNIEQIIYNLK